MVDTEFNGNEKFAAELIHDAPCGIVVTDQNGRLQYVNGTLAKWLGLADPVSWTGLSFSDLLTTPGRLYYETHLAPMMVLQGFVREISCMLKVASGPSLPVMLSGVVRRDADGNAFRFDYTIFDARERHAYEQQLRDARRKADELAAIARSSPNGILRVDSQGNIKSWNASAESLFSSDEEFLHRSVSEAVPLSVGADWFHEMIANREMKSAVIFEASHKNDQEFEITAAPIREHKSIGEQPEWSVVLRDVTVRKRAEDQLKTIMHETQHRLKNSLSIIIAIARQTLPQAESAHFIKRLRVLSKAQDALTGENWKYANLEEILAFAAEQAGGLERFRFNALPGVKLAPQQTTALSMALHELVTNSIKYGALSVPIGHLRVDCWLEDRQGGERLRMTWQEQDGPNVVPPEREGFGTLLIRAVLAEDLDNNLDFRPEGFRCEIGVVLSQAPETDV